MTDETTQALLPVTVEDKGLVPFIWAMVEDGEIERAEQAAARHRLAHSLPSQADATSGEEMRLREALAGLVKWSDNIMRAHGVTGEQIAVTKARAALTKGAE